MCGKRGRGVGDAGGVEQTGIQSFRRFSGRLSWPCSWPCPILAFSGCHSTECCQGACQLLEHTQTTGIDIRTDFFHFFWSLILPAS